MLLRTEETLAPLDFVQGKNTNFVDATENAVDRLEARRSDTTAGRRAADGWRGHH